MNLTDTEVAVSDALTNVAENPGILKTYFDNALPQVISLMIQVLVAVIILIVGIKVVKVLTKGLEKALNKSKIETGVSTFLCSLFKYVLYFLLLMVILGEFGITTGSIVAVLGSAGLTVGLALQGSLSNFAGGVLILVLKPFVVGDYIVDHSSGREGTVSEISICYTRLTTPDNRVVMLPNGTLSNAAITNCSRMPKRRIDMTVGVSYRSDLSFVKDVLKMVLDKNELVLKEEPIDIFVDSLGDSAVVMGIHFWVNSGDYWNAKWQITEEVKLNLDVNRIEIPYPQVTVHGKVTN